MSAYFRKYPSMSCTSERHIPHAFTLTRISSGWTSGTGTSSRTGGLPYSCMRAAFICVSCALATTTHLLVDQLFDAEPGERGHRQSASCRQTAGGMSREFERKM